ncbi:uncharacterized protein N7483_006889 [Penicillium malachiteum]|uniref:uncharacterized protein n=1 Tax=Penicillium malachiteum TaxID=1324776 RepID=UPI00254854BB|nr:uncharacterized protein N7483_006889 [Penicillium malachiteum]KAJ5725532.1 hypothetical protein N7483_006889 [Penicillium malachiteum]
MSPTLTTLVIRAHKVITIGIFSLWIAAAVGFMKIDFLVMEEDEWEFFDLCLSTSLLTWLVCRLIVTVRKDIWGGSLVYRLSSAHHHQSRLDALVLFIFSCAWIWEVLLKMIIMIWLTVLGGAVYAFHIYGDAIAEMDADTENGIEFDIPEALENIKKFKTEMKFDPAETFGWIPPKIMVACLVLAWISSSTLSFYVVRVGWKSLKVIFRLPSEESAASAPKLYVA